MIIHGSRSVFLDSRLVLMVFHGSRLVYIRAGCQRRVARCGEHLKRYPLDLYFGPKIPLGLAGCRPALA